MCCTKQMDNCYFEKKGVLVKANHPPSVSDGPLYDTVPTLSKTKPT